MTWITDAKKQVEEKNRREIERIAEEQRLSMEKNEEQRNLEEQRHLILMDLVRLTKIESLISDIKAQGLLVSIEVGYVEEGPGSLFKKFSREVGGWDSGMNVYNIYCFSWKITEQTTNLNKYFRLGFNETYGTKWVKDGLFSGHEETDYKKIFYVPTTTAPEVEAQIKAWLVQIFSEQK